VFRKFKVFQLPLKVFTGPASNTSFWDFIKADESGRDIYTIKNKITQDILYLSNDNKVSVGKMIQLDAGVKAYKWKIEFVNSTGNETFFT